MAGKGKRFWRGGWSTQGHKGAVCGYYGGWAGSRKTEGPSSGKRMGWGPESQEHRNREAKAWVPESKTSSPLGFPTSPPPLGEAGRPLLGPGNYPLAHTALPAGRRCSGLHVDRGSW